MPDSGTERITRVKDCRHGRMIYLLTDRFIGASLDLYGEYSEGEAEVFAQLLAPGDIAIEVGANIGAHTVYLAQLVGPTGRVYAFEPQRVVFQLLCANIALNEAFNVRSFQAGAGAQAGCLNVPDVNYHAAGSNFGGVSFLEPVEGEAVPLITLDSLSLPSLRLLKIDVEGMEAQVLEGARGLIRRHRPVLYVENDRRAQSRQLLTLIHEFGYDMWWHFPALFNPENHAGVSENIFGSVASGNLLCVPREHESAITGFRKVAGPDDWWDARDGGGAEFA